MQKTNVPNHPPNCPNCIYPPVQAPKKHWCGQKTKEKGQKILSTDSSNIIAEVKIECSSHQLSLFQFNKTNPESGTPNLHDTYVNSCASKILLTPKALGIKFLDKYFWDEHIHLLQVQFVCTCIILFQLAPFRGGSQQPLQPLARKLERNTILWVTY
jgi:hypothetical protein